MFPIYFSNKMPALPTIPLPRDSTLFSSDPPFDPSSPTSLSLQITQTALPTLKRSPIHKPLLQASAPRAENPGKPQYLQLDLHAPRPPSAPSSRRPTPVSSASPALHRFNHHANSINILCLSRNARSSYRSNNYRASPSSSSHKITSRQQVTTPPQLSQKEKIGQQISKRKKTDVTGHVMRTVAHVLPRRL